MALNIISNVQLDMKAPNTVIVYANQYDSAGSVKAQLLNSGESWSVPAGAKAVVMFKKSDNIGGFYDVTEFGVAAVEIDSDRSVIYINYDPQVLTTAGRVAVQINFYQNDQRLSSFAFYTDVQASAVTSGEIASSWLFNILSQEIAQTLTVATTPQAMTDWLEANITQETGYVIDNTLTVAGAASDAQATGKMVTVSNLNPNTVANKVWVKKTPAEIEIPMMEDHNELSRQLSDNDKTLRQPRVNFLDMNAMLNGKDIVSGTGAIIDKAGYRVSGKIYNYDITRGSKFVNMTYKYAYCYDENDAYLGRVDVSDNRTIGRAYPTTEYFRVVLLSNGDDNAMVTYVGIDTTDYLPYNYIAGLVDETLTKRYYPADAKIVGDAIGALRGNVEAIGETTERINKNKIDYNGTYGNLFDYKTRLENTDIVSGNGQLVSGTGFFTSTPIFIDGSKKLYIKKQGWGDTQWAYCYKNDGTYLGRYDCQWGAILNTVAGNTVDYIRVLGQERTGVNLTVLQRDFWVDGIYDYSTIKGYGQGFAPKRIRIANYNTGDFTGVNLSLHSRDAVLAYREVIQSFNADVATFEYDTGRTDQGTAFNEVIKTWYKFGALGNGSDYNYHAIGSNFDILFAERVTYSFATSTQYTHKEFFATKVLINFIPILIITLHADWRDNTVRGLQLDEIISYCNNYENVIITGDFNPEDYVDGVKQSNNLTYATDLQKFITAGYTPINANNSYLGVVNTLASGGDGPWDNILIKGERIKIAGFGRTERNWMNDHYPIYADLIIG